MYAYYVNPTFRGITTFAPSETNYFPRPCSVSAGKPGRSEESPLEPCDVRVLEEIAKGRDTVGSLLKESGWSKPAFIDELEGMIDGGYLSVEGFRKRLKITPRAYNTVPRLSSRIHKEKKSTTHTTKFDVSWWLSFKLVFGALLGFFFGWLLISGLAALIYWAVYSYLLEPYVPASILPWVPFQNPIVDFGLGILSGTWFFLKINPTQLFTSFSKR